jgi:hypothetical protein
MFDLFKDIEKYKGITPYASEHYGVYQPLLGWESRLTKNWIQRGAILIDPHVRRILNGRLSPGPQEVKNPDPREFLAVPLQPGSGKSPFRVTLLKDLNSELLKLVQISVQTFVDNPANNGRLPEDREWNQVIEINNLMDAKIGLLRKVNDIHRNRLFETMQAQAQGHPITEATRAAAEKTHLEQMQYESQIAAFLLFHAEGHPGFAPNELKKLFSVQVAPPLSDLFRPTDPLANIDPNDKSGALSPVGFIHLFRQYFFDLGTFLGEPVEHIWLAPGTTIELIEVSTRRILIERTEESALETTNRSEQSTAVKDELSDAVKSENGSSTKLGVSTTHTVNYGVYQGTATANFGSESTLKDARESTHKQNREQTEKLSSEIKRSFKSVFKTVTETSDTRSRRYVLQNTSPDLINYELRRKMRRVGVQMQDLGTRLCWQVFVDDAGATLGLAELVHFAESPDLANLKQPEIPYPATIKKPFSARIPFQGYGKNDDNGPGADYGLVRPGSYFDGQHHGNRTNTNIPEAADLAVIMGPFSYKFDLPQADYFLSGVNILGPQGNKKAIARPATFTPPASSFELVMDVLNFGGASEILLDVELVFTPGSQAITDYKASKKDAQTKYDAEKQRLLEKSFMESVRQRIKDASNIKSRPSWDLREEERTIIYRKLISRLMLDSWKLPDTDDNRRLSHVRSEVIRAIFDVDAMLYFVAPEWWMPRRHKSQYTGKADFHLTDKDLVKWDDIEKRDDNYKITEDSAPAKLGSSLGWLLQLDGDNLRNAFLNAPWVKAVIPIRPGREKAALNWLHTAVEGDDGWNAPYTATTPEDAILLAQVAADGNPPTIGNVLEKIAEQMAKENGEIKNVLEADRVFEHGFDHLAGGFDAGLPANKVFSQWVSVLPTDQIVAIEYEPTTLFKP